VATELSVLSISHSAPLLQSVQDSPRTLATLLLAATARLWQQDGRGPHALQGRGNRFAVRARPSRDYRGSSAGIARPAAVPGER